MRLPSHLQSCMTHLAQRTERLSTGRVGSAICNTRCGSSRYLHVRHPIKRAAHGAEHPLDAATSVMALIARSLSLILIVSSSKYSNKSGKHADFSLQPIAVQRMPALYRPACYKLRCDLDQLRAC